MAAAPKVNMQDVRKIIYENYNNTDVRFSNDEILAHLLELDTYRGMDLDVLDFEELLLEMETSGMLRPIAQNFNTRYFRLWGPVERTSCKDCGNATFFVPSEEGKICPKCKAKL